MKALSFTQPFATLVAISAKKIETRSWSTSYRGRIAIHAAKGFPQRIATPCDDEPFYSALEAAGYYRYFRNGAGHRDRGPWNTILPLGSVVATVTLVDCLRIGRTVGGSVILHGSHPIPVDEPELSFGNFAPGRWGWVLADVVKLPKPVPARGAMGLWEWSES